ncbi:MAG: hypothetical protein Q4F95_10370 [Oscillospiraceae bacterium]|nr:hypothetical protein [Oscillospiraceae bacterium]
MNTVTQDNFADMRSEAINRTREMQMRSRQNRQNPGNYMMNRSYNNFRQHDVYRNTAGMQTNTARQTAEFPESQNMRNENRNNSFNSFTDNRRQYVNNMIPAAGRTAMGSQRNEHLRHGYNQEIKTQQIREENIRNEQPYEKCADEEQSARENFRNQQCTDMGGNGPTPFNPAGAVNDMMGKIFSLVSGEKSKIDKDFLIILLFIIILAKEGADLKLLIALGYILL